MRNQRGQAAVLGYVAVGIITLLGGLMLNHAFAIQQHQQTQELYTSAFYLAEGGLEDAIAHFTQDIANFQVGATTARYPAVGSLTTTFSSGATTSSVIQEIAPGQTTVVDPDGISLFAKNYHITTTAPSPANPAVTVTLHQIFTRRLIYTFQHAVFYDADLEWLPGADMSLVGRVHSNSDIYLASVTGKILTIDGSYLHAAGDLYHKRKDNGTIPGGVVQIDKAGLTPTTFPVLSQDSTSPTWTTDALTTWNGSVQTSVHGVTKRAVPVVGSTAPGDFYDTNADVKVLNCTMTQNGVTLVPGTDIPTGTCTTTTTFYNNREGKYVKMAVVDLAKLGGGVFGGQTFANHLPSNGLLYATRNDAPATQQPGIELINGAQINRAGGLTVVTNQPAYIRGDYNTTSKKPAAVIGDALNLLSSSWSDANSTSGLNSRVATPTTFNSAFIAGIKTTTSGNYNGGLENYPRMHENWSGKQLSITGSFVSLWNSQIATGNWMYGSPQYTAPNRVWSWDASFENGNNMPPFTPWAVEIVKGAWWKQ